MTGAPRRWVLASGNPGKLAEFCELLAGFEVVPQSDFGLVSPEETAETFVENALLKARYAAEHSGLPAIADDSGLAVDALGGAPGIHSARFAGPDATDQANVARLLEALIDVPEEHRTARFCCVIVALVGPHDPAPLLGFGQWPGIILREPRGDSGFGYDPVFFDPQLGLTAAEMAREDKNRISHRARALEKIRTELEL